MRHVFGWLFGVVQAWGFLLAVVLVLNAPLLVAVRLLPARTRPVVAGAVISVGFAAAGGYMLWRMDWFDVWRHGVPPLGYLLRVYLPTLLGIAAAGWYAGVRLQRSAPHRRG